MDKKYYVYIITNKPKGTLYIGITNDLQRRVNEHQNKLIEGFSKKYNLTVLVYFEAFNYIFDALNYEKKLKKWHRNWKINLIEKNNPEWNDLYKKYFF